VRGSRTGSVVVAAFVLGGVVVVGLNQGEPVHDVRLLSGAAWLTSAKVGQLTLLDGSSAEVAAQVQVAPAGNSLDVTQQGANAYAIDQTAGTIRRVDGATFDLSTPETPIPDTHAGLTAMPGPNVLYTLDSQRGVLAATDPRNLTRRGDLISLASEFRTGSAAVDDAGTLWAIDDRTGNLSYVANGKRTTRPQVAQPGPSVLAIANGHPVVVNLAARKTIPIDRGNGRPGTAIDLDLRPTDTVGVSGSAHSDRLYLMVSRGVLTVCDLPAGSCDTTIPLDAGGTYGPAVEAGDQLFVPDYTTGQVWIIDIAKSRIAAKPTVLSPAGRFQLLSRDGVVFYNDTNSERAGVIQFDGTVVSTPKYDPKNPAKGLNGQSAVQSGQTKPAGTSKKPGSSPPSSPSNRPDQPANSSQHPSGDPNQPSRPSSPTDTSSTTNTTSITNTTSTTPADPEVPRLEIKMSKSTPTENEPITLQVTTNAGEPTSAHWTFGDGGEGDGTTTTHKWTTTRAAPYLVTVTVTMPDDQVVTTSVGVPVSATPTARLAVAPPAGRRISGGGIDCPATCSVDLPLSTQITLTAQPDAAHIPGRWGGACGGTTNTCDVTVDAAKNVSYTFDPKPTPKFTLTITPPNGGVITRNGPAGSGCPAVCQLSLDPGTSVQLIATSGAMSFYLWGGDCASAQQNPSCTLTMDRDHTVSARYVQHPFLNSVSCETRPNKAFLCTADAGPPEFAFNLSWSWDGLGINNQGTTLGDKCRHKNFDVTVSFAGTSKSTMVQNCG
jgi:hypothetical protein